ncbi:hypothetical protein KVT40_005347 [Elsinoe batatas]|uniref:Uncharacterized protein n=1 Tax=Elsinoe batatas TaxID=2601811 RepID=A0A8K0PFB1_9PEZI|nr:hypothetical protein KVT40_005347 [Elsinoe batatas]
MAAVNAIVFKNNSAVTLRPSYSIMGDHWAGLGGWVSSGNEVTINLNNAGLPEHTNIDFAAQENANLAVHYWKYPHAFVYSATAPNQLTITATSQAGGVVLT